MPWFERMIDLKQIDAVTNFFLKTIIHWAARATEKKKKNPLPESHLHILPIKINLVRLNGIM